MARQRGSEEDWTPEAGDQGGRRWYGPDFQSEYDQRSHQRQGGVRQAGRRGQPGAEGGWGGYGGYGSRGGPASMMGYGYDLGASSRDRDFSAGAAPMRGEAWQRNRYHGEPYRRGGYRGQEAMPWGDDETWSTPQYGGGLAGQSSDFAGWSDRGAERRPWQGVGHGGGRQRQDFRGRGPSNYTRSDERITEDINERLTDDPDVDASDIRVEVSGGRVTLHGEVQERWIKHRIEDVTEACAGVQDIDNRIRVTRQQV